ncbi:caspase family protein [Streptomyces hirsutus]|uniref:caspase family protein n=1 Tax=Streptomyces hirsutus TaxID=35620 RepID=UPI0006E2F0DE|nr:caspase family protein [Streptomyces hirsutus]
MVVRALVVCPETYEGSSLRPMPGSLASGVRFASWLVNHVDEPCSLTFLTNTDHLSGPPSGPSAHAPSAPPSEPPSDPPSGRPPAEPLTELLPARLRAATADTGRTDVRTDLASADLLPIGEFFSPAGSSPVGELGKDDAFVLYWIGHGGINRENGNHLLYLPHNGRLALEDLTRGMAGPHRPGRQLFVIDACREADTARPGDGGGGQTLTIAAGAVPHPDWLGLVLYGARHGEQALFDEGRGGVFTDRLLDALETLPSAGRLDLERIEQTAVALAARFRAAYRQGDPEYGQIPTHYWLSHRGDLLVDRDFLPGAAVTVTQAETLHRTVSRACLTPAEESEVWEWLHRYGPRLADDDLTLPQTAVRVTQLPHRADGSHCITDLCVVLARIGRLRDGIHRWYASWATDKGLPPLADVSVAPTPVRRRGHLVIDLEREDELGHGETSAERGEPQNAAGPRYRAKAWFYTGHQRRPIRLPRQSWRKEEFPSLVKLIYGKAHTKVQSALDGAWVEFIVDRDLFGHRFDALPRFSVPSGKAPLLGDGGPVVLRDGWRHHGGPQTLSWQRRASLLDSVPAARLQWTDCASSCRTGEAEFEQHARTVETAFTLNAVIGTETDTTGNGTNGARSASAPAGANGGANGAADPCAGIVLSRPLADRAHADLVGTALNNGALLAIWPARSPADDCRRGGDDGAVCDGALVRESLMRRLDGRPLHDLPEIVFDLRRTGGTEAEVFRDMVVLFDDPRRSPLVRGPLNPP